MDNECDYCKKDVTRNFNYIFVTFSKVSLLCLGNVVTIGHLQFCDEACQINYNKGFANVKVRTHAKKI